MTEERAQEQGLLEPCLPGLGASLRRGAEKLLLGTTTTATNDGDVAERTHLARDNYQWLVGLGV